jgi:hypothetical protein
MITHQSRFRATDRGGQPEANGLSRRNFLQAAAATGGGFLLGLTLSPPSVGAVAAGSDAFSPNAYRVHCV